MFHVVYRKQWLVAIAGIFLMLSGLSACGSTPNNSGGNTTDTTTPIKIGFSTSLTGDFSNDGKAQLQGYQYWASYVNANGGLLGHKVTLDYLDDKSDPTTVQGIYSTLIRDHHDDLIFGPFAFTTLNAGMAADRFGYAMLAGSGSLPDTFTHGVKNLFSVSLSTRHYLQTFAQYILSLPAGTNHPTAAAYAGVDDTFAGPPITEAQGMLEKGNIQTVYSHTYADETVDITPIAQAIAAKKPDIVILGTENPELGTKYINLFKQQHFSPRAIIELSGPDQGQVFTQAIGGPQVAEGVFVPNGGWWPDSPSYQNADFVKGFSTAYKISAGDISSDAVQAFSCGQVLQQAVAKAKSIKNADLLRVLHDYSNTWNTLQGPVHFNSVGEDDAAVAYLFQWQAGQLIPVYPSGQAKNNPEYPKPTW